MLNYQLYLQTPKLPMYAEMKKFKQFTQYVNPVLNKTPWLQIIILNKSINFKPNTFEYNWIYNMFIY